MIYLITFALAILPAVAVVATWFAWVLPERRQNARLRARVADLTGRNVVLGQAYRGIVNERHRARMRIAELCRERLDHACNRDTVRP